MKKKLSKLYLFLLLTFLSAMGLAQKEAIVMGKIDNPLSYNIFVEYKKNLFTLDEAVYESTVDLNSLFGFKINLTQPQTIVLNYLNEKIRLFVSPGDTLILTFDGNSMMSSLRFEGKNAAANRFLFQADKRFPAWADEKKIDYGSFLNKPADFQTFIDTSSASQLALLNAYNSVEKGSFTKSFYNFISADITYWRLYHLLHFYQKKGFYDSNIAETTDKALANIDLNNADALNNVHYLKFLNLYFDYWFQKNKADIGQLPPDALVEMQSMVQIVLPRADKLQVWENPLSSRNVVTVLSKSAEAFSQYLTTNEPLSFKIGDVFVYDYFLKIKTSDGRIGWVPQSYVQTVERQIIERHIYPRFCFDTANVMCGFEPILTGKTLYFWALRDIILSTGSISKENMIQRTEDYITQNRDFRPYNDILRGVLKVVETDRDNLMQRLIVPDDCSVEYFNLNKLFFDKNLSAQFGESRVAEQPLILSADPSNASKFSASGAEFMDYHSGKPNIFKGLAINENIPPFKLTDINGTEIKQQDLLGKVVYIDFWATWCSPCQSQLTHSQGLLEKYKDRKDIVFLYISVDLEKEEWLNYLKTNSMKGIQVNEASIIPLNFMIQGLPNFFIIDKNGRVAYNSRISTKIDAESMVEFLLKAK